MLLSKIVIQRHSNFFRKTEAQEVENKGSQGRRAESSKEAKKKEYKGKEAFFKEVGKKQQTGATEKGQGVEKGGHTGKTKGEKRRQNEAVCCV